MPLALVLKINKQRLESSLRIWNEMNHERRQIRSVKGVFGLMGFRDAKYCLGENNSF